MSGTALTLVLMVLCLLAEAFFSGSEIAVVSADPMKLRHAAAKGSKGAAMVLKMLERPDWLLATTLVGTNIAVVTNTTLATAFALQMFGERGSWIAILVVAPVIWVFGEIVPKSVFQQKADTLAPLVVPVLRFSAWVFSPLLVLFTAATRLLTRIMGGEPRNPFTLREEIVSMLQMPSPEGDISPDEQSMIRRVFDFGETTAEEVMVPLVDVAAVEEGAKVAEALTTAASRSHHRLPVFAERVDQVVGVVDTLEILGRAGAEPIAPYVRPVDYVPGSKGIGDLLQELREGKHLMAVVVDEFGGAEGIVTIEDIVEEVVEAIEDEFDSAKGHKPWLRRVGDRHYLASGRVEADVLEEELGLTLPEGKYTTLAGLLLQEFQDVPEKGEILRLGEISFTVERRTPRLVQEVRIRW